MHNARPHVHPLLPAWWLGFAMVALAVLPGDGIAPRVMAAVDAVRKWWAR
jgi:hypothetical protein